MDIKSLKQFLITANKAGYITGNERAWTKEKDKSTTITFTKGKWSMDDNFFGGEPYGGRLVVFYDHKPVWLMVYYGWVEIKANPDEVYKTLRAALKKMPAASPYRGPRTLKQGQFKYLNSWAGKVSRFSGTEKILKGKTEIYRASYMGGWTDRRTGV